MFLQSVEIFVSGRSKVNLIIWSTEKLGDYLQFRHVEDKKRNVGRRYS